MIDDKKGQVTIFVIIGIVLLFIIGVLFYLYSDKLKVRTSVDFDATSVEPLKNYIEECIKKEGDEAISIVARKGGRIDAKLGYWYSESGKEEDKEKIAYLCYTDEFKSCENKMPFIKKEIESELNAELSERIRDCIDLSKIRNDGYNVREGQMRVFTEVGDENVVVNVHYPLTISKGGSVVSQEDFSHNFKVPLGRLAEIAEDIVDDEIIYGRFFYETYEILHPDVMISVWHPVETKVYTVGLRDEELKLRFAVRGWVAPDE